MPKTTEFHAAFARALQGVSPRVVTLDEAASTMDAARALAREGAPHLSVVVANDQTKGRGRLDREWVSAPGESLTTSWVARPTMSVERWTLIPLLVGVAACEAIRTRTKVETTLKWPNDLLTKNGKLGGILVEAETPTFVVVGLGVNVNQTSFPAEIQATSLALEGALRLDRADLLAAILNGFDAALKDPVEAMERYRQLCSTIGQHIRVERPNAEPMTGTATGIDDNGALIVGDERVRSGDVIHVRKIESST